MQFTLAHDSIGKVQPIKLDLSGTIANNLIGRTFHFNQEIDKLVIEWAMGNKLQCANTMCKDRKSTRLNSSHANISYAVFCLKKNILMCSRLTRFPFGS